MKQWLMKSIEGPLYLLASDQGLHGVYWRQDQTPLLKRLDGSDRAIQILQRTEQQLSEYFAGTRKNFDLPLSPLGTPFQKSVWNTLLQIPYGETLSYQAVAKQLNKDGASRAVGAANGRNPICIIIPCHRVIAADGTMGGYSGGLENKEKLLKLERSVKFFSAAR